MSSKNKNSKVTRSNSKSDIVSAAAAEEDIVDMENDEEQEQIQSSVTRVQGKQDRKDIDPEPIANPQLMEQMSRMMEHMQAMQVAADRREKATATALVSLSERLHSSEETNARYVGRDGVAAEERKHSGHHGTAVQVPEVIGNGGTGVGGGGGIGVVSEVDVQVGGNRLRQIRTTPARGRVDSQEREYDSEGENGHMYSHAVGGNNSKRHPYASRHGSGSMANRSELPRMPMKIKEYSGENKTQSIRSWIDQLTTIQNTCEWSDDIIMKQCAMHLSGTAQQWYLTSGRYCQGSWKEFSTELMKKFTMEINPWLTTRYTENIKQKRDESCRDFMDRVRKELRSLNIDSEERLCEVFMSGCHPEIGAGIIRSIGRDAVDAKRLEEIAVRLEMAERMEKKRGGVGGTLPGSTAYASVPSSNRNFTSGEKINLGKDGGCFYCGDKSHMKRNCPKLKDGNGVGGKKDGSSSGTGAGTKERLSLEEFKKTLKCSACGQMGHTAKYCKVGLGANKSTMSALSAGSQNIGKGGNIRSVSHIDTASEESDNEDCEFESDMNPDDHDEYEEEYGEYLGRVRMIRTVACAATTEETPTEATKSNYMLELEYQRSRYTTGINNDMPQFLHEEHFDEAFIEAYKENHLAKYGMKIGTISAITDEKNDDHYSVGGYVYGQPVECMIDCGATRSCISYDMVNRMSSKVKEKVEKSVATQKGYMETANGGKLTVEGTVVVAMQLKSDHGVREMDVELVVVRALTVPCLLGTDFLNKYGTGLSWRRGHRYLTLKNGDHVPLVGRDGKSITGLAGVRKDRPRVNLIRLDRDVKLRAHSATAFPGGYAFTNPKSSGNGKESHASYMALGDETLLTRGILMAPTVHSGSGGNVVRKHGNRVGRINMVLQVTNTTDDDITYHRGQVIGTIQQVDIMELKEQQEISNSEDVKESIQVKIKEKIEEQRDDGTNYSALKSGQDKEQIMKILSEYTHLFDDRQVGEARQAGDTVMHNIETGSAAPRRVHAYRQSPAMEDIIHTEIEKLLKDEVIVHSNSPWASPIVMVKKPEGKWRMCIDYRNLNKLTVSDVYPLPAIDQMLYSMSAAKVFTTMDLQSAYNQILVAPKDQAKTAFIHRTGLYQYRRMPFGLRNAPSTFQRFMNMMFGCEDENMWIMVMVYLDDIIIFSATVDEHGIHLKKVLAIISRHGLKLKLSKCNFAMSRVKYLGHVLDGTGVQVDPDKVKAVREMPSPRKIVELQSFLGMVGYYRKFIPDYAEVAAPLVKLLRKGEKWVWTTECQAAVDTFKDALTSAPVLCMPDYTKQFIVQTDASMVGISGVLSQRYTDDGGNIDDKPVAYVSRTLKRHENNYSVTHLELLAVMWSLKKYRHYIQGNKFLLQTDHIALQSIRHTKEMYSGRMGRWVLQLQEYEPFDIEYRKGTRNANADALSRLPLAIDSTRTTADANNVSCKVMVLGDNTSDQKGDEVKDNVNWQLEETHVHVQGDVSISISDIAKMQQDDTMWKPIIERVAHENDIDRDEEEAIASINAEQYTMVGDPPLLYRRYLANNKAQTDNLVLQLCLPKVMVPDILRELHDEPYSGHLGVDKTWAKIFNRYYWKRMRADIEHYCASCIVCERRKVPKRMDGIPVLSPQVDWMKRYGPMECIAIDIVGPITSSNRASLILTIVEVYTRWGVAVPVVRQDTKSIVHALIHRWINIYGMPVVIMSDNGPGFASAVMKLCMKAMGVKIKNVLPYHPQSNGVCERVNATIINMLASYVQDPTKQHLWADYVTHVIFAYNTAVHSATGYTPYYLVYGREARIASEALVSGSHMGARTCKTYPAYVKEIHRNAYQAHQHIENRITLRHDQREKENAMLKSLAGYAIGDKVMVYSMPRSASGKNISKKLLSPYLGPFIVINQFNDVSYQVKDDSNNKKLLVHVSRMKRFHERDEDLKQREEKRSDYGIGDEEDNGMEAHTHVGDERDHGIAGHTRKRRQQRIRQRGGDRESVQQPVDSSPGARDVDDQERKYDNEQASNIESVSTVPAHMRDQVQEIEEGEVV